MSILGVIKYYLHLDRASDTLVTIRLDRCFSCPFYDGFGTCMACGCLIFKKAKVQSEKCPRKYW